MSKTRASDPPLLIDRVRDQLRRTVCDKLQPGDRLPSVRRMCSQFKVSSATIVHAVKRLEREGLVVCQHGRGTFVNDTTAPCVAITSRSFERYLDAEDVQRRLARAALEYGMRFRSYESLPSHLDLVQDQVRGIISTVLPPDETLRDLVRQKIVIVSDSTSFVPGVVTVGKNSFEAGAQAAEALIAAGHRRIGYVGLHQYRHDQDRYSIEFDSELHEAGITEALLRHRIEPDARLFSQFRHRPPSVERAGARGSQQILDDFMALPEPPTALIFFDYASIGRFMLPTMERMGLHVPEIMSVIALGYLDDKCGLSMVGIQMKDFLTRAIERLHMCLQFGRVDTSQHVWLDVSLEQRGSVAAPRQGSK